MVIYLAFIFPLLLSAVLYVFFKRKTKYWEVIIPFVATVLFIVIAKWISISSLTSDTEYLGGYVTEARYYEAWDEEVDCRHPIYCESCSGTGKDRSCYKYVCGHHHMYDVDYHSEYWRVQTSLGGYNISEAKYNALVRKFKMEPIFHDMHRDYHSIDGDMYYVTWDNTDEKLEPVVDTHSYENRPRVSHSLYRYQEVDSFDIKTYKPFNYPKIYNIYHQQVILGAKNDAAEHALQVVNSRLGGTKQVRVYVMVYKSNDRECGIIQERYWEGGNKNELNVCIGVDDNLNIRWAHIFSWTEQEEVKVNIRTHIEESKRLNLVDYVSFIDKEVKLNWKRKHFKEFDYLTIEPTMSQVVWILILSFLINVGLGVWIVMNEFED